MHVTFECGMIQKWSSNLSSGESTKDQDSWNIQRRNHRIGQDSKIECCQMQDWMKWLILCKMVILMGHSNGEPFMQFVKLVTLYLDWMRELLCWSWLNCVSYSFLFRHVKIEIEPFNESFIPIMVIIVIQKLLDIFIFSNIKSTFFSNQMRAVSLVWEIVQYKSHLGHFFWNDKELSLITVGTL